MSGLGGVSFNTEVETSPPSDYYHIHRTPLSTCMFMAARLL